MRNKALIYVIFLVLIAWLQMEQQQNTSASDPGIDTIPEEAIRLRILAHDDSPEEQLLKRKVRDAVNQEIRTLVEGLSEKEEARKTINDNLSNLETIVKDVINTSGSSHTFSIALKDQVEFPTRIYGPLVYPAGTYEALVVSIGEGEGENWWCVLFPPLCFISAEEEDVEKQDETVDKNSNEEVVEKDPHSVDNEKEYSFFIVEKWNQWFGKS
ncbi:stage II sporulation protein R [Alteribacillus bidgolensis]|uniref:Stage II sporulation protein R n=1 Tax=Alteribacillus bidgolensis TaxID=930129 RepID=A0A1G8M1R9_9BACI|nr:stage II sporulation protein R [Alteribacillus bidgolensis]SDI61874.1 stage II sporulation protein R [Alteribacillus bidgolensis]